MVKCGILFKKKGKVIRAWKSRYFILTSHFLYSYHDQSDERPASVTFIEGCFIESLRDDPSAPEYYGFVIHKTESGSDKITLYAKSAQERDEWINALSSSARTAPITDFYTMGSQIGKGKFSTVFEATENATSTS
jgi:hypothetical protein